MSATTISRPSTRKRIRRPPALAGLWSFRPARGFEFCGSNGSAFSLSIFCRNRSRVGASHCSKYFAAVRDRETL
jgi:hypothetical protein